MNIKVYKTNKGEIRYKFSLYMGVSENTGNAIRINKQGFKTKQDAEFEYLKIKYLDSGYYEFKDSVANTNGDDSKYDLVNNKNLGDTNNNSSKIKYKTLYKEWREHYKKTVKESTYNNSLIIFEKHILPTFGEYYIDKIPVKKLQSAIYDWWGKFINFTDVKNFFCRVIEYGFNMGVLKSNICKRVTVPKPRVGNNSVQFYNKDELIIFLEKAKELLSEHWYTFFHLLAFTGLRRGEALVLNWGDLNGNLLSVNKSLIRGINSKHLISDTKTSHSDREIYLDDDTLRILNNWKIAQSKIFNTYSDNKQLIFTNTRNELLSCSMPIKKLNQVIDKYNIKKITPHGFRHTHCSLLFESGASMKEIQERLGHGDIQTTMNIYTHLTSHVKKATSDNLLKFLKD